MAYEEGFRRIKFVARTVLLVGAVLVALALAGAIVANLMQPHLYAVIPIMLLCGMIGFYVAALGGVFWAGAWVVEGFVR
jgi:hypothetical protein